MYNLSNLKSQLSYAASMNSGNHRFYAYNKAVSILGQLTNEEFIKLDDFTHLDYIGPKLNDKFLEYRETGIFRDLKDSDFMIKHRVGFNTVRQHISVIKEIVESVIVPSLPESITLVGSYRRESEWIADIDVIVPEYDFNEAVKRASETFQSLTCGLVKSSFLVDSVNNLQLDINSYKPSELPYALLHHTGSMQNNIMMRGKAKKMGLMLNQYGLFDQDYNNVGKDLVTEEMVYTYLGMNYIEPKNR